MDLYHFQFENKAREQHVADSSNHSLSLMNLLDCSVGLSPFCQSITNDVNVSVATSLHPACAPLKHTIFQVQTLFVLLETLSRSRKKFTHLYITKNTHACTYKKNIFVYVHNSIFKYLFIYRYVVTDTATFEMELCVGTNKPQHMNMYGHIVCD